ncbi:MAG: phosphoglycerate dehydrogenase, partial [Stackebrandtia sp.]
PHLGASTQEAQDNAGLAVVKSVKLALAGEFVPDAVNVKAGSGVAEDVRPLLPLAERLGRLFTAIADAAVQSVTVEVRGEVIDSDVSVLQLAATKGLFVDVADQVTYVNAPLLAAEKGIDIGLFTSVDSPEFHNQVTVRGALADGKALSVSGTVTHGPREVRKLTEIDGYDVEIDAEGPLLILRYTDRPGIVGLIGGSLGDESINIGAMQVSRREAGGEALMIVASDAEVPADLVSKVATTIGATAAASVLLAD